MDYADTLEQSGEYLRLALKHMGQHRIPVDPVNYAVWYEYASGQNVPLRATIEDHLKQNKPITPEVNQHLFKNFVAGKDKPLIQKTLGVIRWILGEIAKTISSAYGKTSNYGKLLESYTEQLQDDIDLNKIRKLVSGLTAETKTMIKSSGALKDRLEETQKKVDVLRTELEQVKQKATTDALTGLANRRAFETTLEKEAEHAASASTPLCLLVIDIDHFKRINDTFGHLVGDKVLRITAGMIKDSIKGRDLAARYGGEEFIVLLPDTPLEGAETVAEQIRHGFETKQWKKKDSGEILGSVTVSIGVALYRPEEALETFFQRADTALYFSKENGRNRVTSEENYQPS